MRHRGGGCLQPPVNSYLDRSTHSASPDHTQLDGQRLHGFGKNLIHPRTSVLKKWPPLVTAWRLSEICHQTLFTIRAERNIVSTWGMTRNVLTWQCSSGIVLFGYLLGPQPIVRLCQVALGASDIVRSQSVRLATTRHVPTFFLLGGVKKTLFLLNDKKKKRTQLFECLSFVL